MSAFVHSDKHFCAIVSFRMFDRFAHTYYSNDHQHLDLREVKNATLCAQMLKDQNIKSVMIRYPQDTLDTLPGPNDLTQEIDFEIAAGFSPMEIIVACQSYGYQASEDPHYRESEAANFIEQTISAAIRRLPGYDDAKTWSID